jgi:hypothetical protein
VVSPDAADRVVGQARHVQVFVVERYLIDWSVADVRALVVGLDALAEQLGEHGVRHVRSVILAVDETCLCVFVGPDEQSVRAANVAAGLPVDRVVAGEMLPL